MGGHNFSTFHLFKRRGTMRSVFGMLGPFQSPLGDIPPAFSFSLHLHLYLFLQGLPTPYFSPPLPITSLHNPSTPQNRALWVSRAASAFIVYPAPLLGVVLCPFILACQASLRRLFTALVQHHLCSSLHLKPFLCLSCGGSHVVLSCSCMFASCLSF